MIDGRPDASGRRIAARGTLLMTLAISAANLAGASVVLFLSLYAVPTPEVDNQGAVYAANFITFGVFMVAAIATGTLWGRRRLYPMRAWLRDDRAPDEAEQRLTLRAPRKPVTLGIVTRSLSAWALGTGIPLFGLALVAIASLAGRDVSETQLAITVLALGGVAVSVGLLITWQAARSVAARCSRYARP